MLTLLVSIVRLYSIFIILLLVIYNLRRIIFTCTTLFFPKKTKNISSEDLAGLPDVLILLPCHNEEAMIPGLCRSMKKLNYPNNKLKIIFINDGSQDHTEELIEEAGEENAEFFCLSLTENGGKASALDAALDKFSFGEIVCVFDADHRPAPDSLLHAVMYFRDPRVAGVSGRTITMNPISSPSSFYSSLENDLHQMITMRAKDRLALAPAMLGSNCYYRRCYLETCGKFRKGALLEDTDITISFTKAGYITHFATDIISYHQVPGTIHGYLRQHLRWSRGFQDISRTYFPALILDNKLPLSLRLELFLFTTGYLDRLAVLGALGITILSYLNKTIFYFPLGFLLFALFTPILQIIIIFLQLHMPPSMWIRLPLIPIFYILDVYASTRGLTDSIFHRPRVWDKTIRMRLEP